MFRFVANLKPYTVPEGRGSGGFASYLLSVDYASGLRALVARIHAARRLLVADNGNFDRIGALLPRLAADAATLAAARRREEAALGRYARPGELSDALQRRYRSLADDVVALAGAARREDRVAEVVAAQGALDPCYLIGMEDFTGPLLVGLGIERGYARLPLSVFTRAADRAVAYAVRTRAGKYGACGAAVFAGLHAVDLDTARAVGRRAGAAGVDGIAAGLGSALDDRGFTDHRVEQGRVIPLGDALPRPYIRVLEIAAGLHLGFAEAAGHRPRFHALGAGTPILLPLLAVLGDRDTYTATDSTAPIKDAYSSSTIALYVDRPAPLKLKAYVLVERWLDGGLPWDCACPHCGPFIAEHPFALAKARRWWIGEGRRRLTPGDLWAPSPLAEHLPLLGMPRDAALRKQAGLARVAHNHWILRRLEAGARRRSRSAAALRGWAETLVGAYVEAGSATAWKGATTAAWSIARAASLALDGVRPGGEVARAR